MTSIQESASHVGGQVFLVANLRDFPTDNFSISFWTNKSTPLFYGAFDSGSTMGDTQTFLEIDVSPGSINVNFAGGGTTFSLAVTDIAASHHYMLCFKATEQGYDVSGYINAIHISTQSVELNNSNNQPMRVQKIGALYIGNRAPDPSQDGQLNGIEASRGVISELHIYENTLSNEQVTQDALGIKPDGVTAYANMPLDVQHYERLRGKWIDIVNDEYSAYDQIRTDNNPTVFADRNYTHFPTQDRTIAFWVRCSDNASGTLISYGDVQNSDHPNDGGSEWQLSEPLGLRLGNISSGLNIALGDWCHIAIVEDAQAKTLVFYLNGVASESQSANGYISGVIADQPLVIGAKKATDDDSSIFTGDIAAMRIWSRALNAHEIADFANGLIPLSASDALTDYFPFGADELESSSLGSRGTYPPFKINEPQYPLLSTDASTHELQVGAERGGMQTKNITALSGSNLSVECWMRSDSAGTLLCLNNDSSTALLKLARKDAQLSIVISNTAPNSSTEYAIEVEQILLSDWHHIAITVSDTTVSAYIDGQQALAESVSPVNPLSAFDNAKLCIGVAAAGETVANASVAEARLWNRPLAVGEIRLRMHHELTQNAFGLSGRWAFENSLGRDTSGKDNHLYAVSKPEFALLQDLDLEPIGSSYLVSQVSLIQDYHFAEGEDGAVTERSCYRVNVFAYNENDQPLTGVALAISIQPEPGNPNTQASLLSEDTGQSTEHPIDVNQPYMLTTNANGCISFALEATDLIAPVLRVKAPFMDQDHALLIFPDRQAHHALANITEEELLNKEVVMNAGEAPKKFLDDKYKNSAPGVVDAIHRFMGTAIEKAPQSSNPVVRPVPQRLLQRVTPNVRRYESATASPDAYNASNDVISGYAVDATHTHISRSLSVNDMADWQLDVVDDEGNFEIHPITVANRAGSLPDINNVEGKDEFTRALLSLKQSRERSEPLNTYVQLIQILDQQDRERGFFSDLLDAISSAKKFVVSTIEHTFENVLDAIKVAVVYVYESATKVVAYALHTIEHAITAVTGLLNKVGATVMGAINFIKALFDWDDIKESRQFIEVILKSSLAATQAKLDDIHINIDNYLSDFEGKAIAQIESLKSTKSEQPGILNSHSSGDRQNVKSSYVSNLLTNHIHKADMPGSANHSVDVNPTLDFNQIKLEHGDKLTHIQQVSGSTELFSNAAPSLSTVFDRVLDLLESIVKGAVGVAKAGLDWMFKSLKKLLDDLDALLKYPIKIPLVTRLYENIIINDGSKLTGYGLASLIGAIPTTIMYKLATGETHGPFKGDNVDDYEHLITDHAEFLVSRHTENTNENATRTATEVNTHKYKAGLGLGGTFLGFVAISGVLNLIATDKQALSPVSPTYNKIAFGINGLFQLTQFPLASSFALNEGGLTGNGTAIAGLEETIWGLQFFPWVLDGISAFENPASPYQNFGTVYKVGMLVFGLVHMGLFFTVFGLEINDPNITDKEDVIAKIIGNVSSCIPELTAAMPASMSDKKFVINLVSYAVWEMMNVARYATEARKEVVFSAH
ncbi:LamG domain-containing protein [Rheinheimera baltica]|uniref:LamG domain-containing protein n=1 Tax=Rheinheimera baltica TaxID=67576 RepID=UPI00273F5B8D|nr:LamG-like jellyroll fold domain-containing protein [Rheinheimera baltica]MDP5190637.1 hypothetical protein [Rheinheimera baltica]